MSNIRIGNGAGFWGDSPGAPRQLLQNGDLDFLTLEYLAELTLSILAHQKNKNPLSGYVSDVPVVVKQLAENRLAGSKTRLVTNGGGMNAQSCAAEVSRVLVSSDLPQTRVGIAIGDDFYGRLDELMAEGEAFENLDTGETFDQVRDRVVSANVYLGAKGIQRALAEEADIVLTGRIADAALVTGPCIHEFGWSLDDQEQLANATVAGHLIECGAQVSGGIFSDWDESISLGDIGYPIAELDSSGNSVITKPDSTGGLISVQTCSEQLVYEIGDPARYMTPDVIADFTQVRFEEIGENRVKATGGKSQGKPEKLKASIAYRDGYMASSMIVVVGKNAEVKARQAGKAIFEKLSREGIEFTDTNVEVLGAGDSMPGLNLCHHSPWDVVLRVSARAPERTSTDRMLRELAPLVTSGPPGVTGYTGARGRSTPVLSFWPALVSRDHFKPEVDVRPAANWLSD